MILGDRSLREAIFEIESSFFIHRLKMGFDQRRLFCFGSRSGFSTADQEDYPGANNHIFSCYCRQDTRPSWAVAATGY